MVKVTLTNLFSVRVYCAFWSLFQVGMGVRYVGLGMGTRTKRKGK